MDNPVQEKNKYSRKKKLSKMIMNPASVVVIDFPIFSWLINSVVRVAQPELTAYQQIWDQRPQGDRFCRSQSCFTNADVMCTSLYAIGQLT